MLELKLSVQVLFTFKSTNSEKQEWPTDLLGVMSLQWHFLLALFISSPNAVILVFSFCWSYVRALLCVLFSLTIVTITQLWPESHAWY